MFYAVKTPKLLTYLFSSFIWKIPNDNKTVYLTFDDGPTEKVTRKILEVLKNEKVKASFFCVGKNVEKYPDLFACIKAEGHAVGNHTNTHLNGWKTNKKQYFEDVEEADKLIKSNLFRPPYGKLNWRSKKDLQRKYKIVMWDVAGGDFDQYLSIKDVVKNIINNVNPGSIVVLHDNQKFMIKTVEALPIIIKELKAKKYRFGLIN
ncbi:polysaccharide deacetylase family protein [Bacteroidota bacterium]|nr:polysaccharide deacetylase family protein [Bacteroidota bacterium]